MWEEAYEAFWWLERFHLTPDQVDELPVAVFTRLPGVVALYDERRDEQG